MNPNKKAQSLYGAFILILLFLAVWVFWLGPYLQAEGEKAITDSSLTGFEAFLWANLNLIIAIIFLVAVYILFKFGGS